jgi:hypothetical protein
MRKIAYIIAYLLGGWKGLLMSWSVNFVIDLTKVAAIVLLLTFGLYWAEKTQITLPARPPETPKKEDESAKKKRLLPWRSDSLDDENLVGKISINRDKAPDGTPVKISFPIEEDIRNIGSYKNGYGMCVMSSIEMASRWANLVEFRGLRNWCAKEAGGGYPKKVDDQIARFAKEFEVEEAPSYLQYEGDDLEFLKLVLKTYRMAAVTYSGRDGVRYKGPIAHMVCLVHLDDDWAAIYDNNGKPGDLLWMTPREFKDRWLGGGNGWVFVWTAPPPPPAVKGK